MRELDLLRIVEELLGGEDVEVPAGKHDAAFVKFGDSYLVLSCDTVNELCDFPPGMTAEEYGHMALAVTLSDLAASAAKPLYFLSSISLKAADAELLRRIILGMKRLAERYGVKIVGGDIDFGSYVSIAGFAVGVAERVLTRCGARPGEKLFLTDITGKAELCLRMLREGYSREELPFAEKLYAPTPRVEEGLKIAEFASAATDVSDSLAVSLHNMACDVRLVVDIDSVDLSEIGGDEELFLYGGGDYELLFAADDSDVGIEIGYVEEGGGVFARKGGRLKRVERRGYEHFQDSTR
ncbi:MAG: thiamine-phosphate kinase [Archaeoglobaceae archaeon]